MRFLLRHILLYALSLFLLQAIFAGVTITGGLTTYLLAGFLLTLMYYTIRPILQLVTLPINIATLGLFSVIINTFILYLISVLLPSITIEPFSYPGFSFIGFIVPKIYFNAFFAYLICSLVISCITTVISWLFGE